jgi:hypothetical protein
MIPRESLPPISSILSRLDIPPGRRGRTRCPIHRGDNQQAFSYDDERGVWYCHRCAMGGDAITLTQRALDTDYRGALAWLGLRPGEIPQPQPDPATVRRERARQGLQRWARETARWMRDQYFIRNAIEVAAADLIQIDPTDEAAWDALAWAVTGRERIGYMLDIMNGKSEADILDAYRHLHPAERRQAA